MQQSLVTLSRSDRNVNFSYSTQMKTDYLPHWHMSRQAIWIWARLILAKMPDVIWCWHLRTWALSLKLPTMKKHLHSMRSISSMMRHLQRLIISWRSRCQSSRSQSVMVCMQPLCQSRNTMRTAPVCISICHCSMMAKTFLPMKRIRWDSARRHIILSVVWWSIWRESQPWPIHW